MQRGPISEFMIKHYRHFNAAAMVDAAKGYEQHLLEGGKMMITLAGAMSTAELGISLAEMIRQGKVDIISCKLDRLDIGLRGCIISLVVTGSKVLIGLVPMSSKSASNSTSLIISRQQHFTRLHLLFNA